MLDTNFVMPWLKDGVALAISVSLVPVLAVLFTRWVREGKPYLGVYTAFWAGEGISFAVMEGLTSVIIDGTTPQRFYTETWFYLVLFAVVYPVTVLVARRFEDDAERRGRPKSIRTKLSQAVHTYACLPTVMCFTIWSFFPVADYHDPLGATAVFIALLAFWWIYLAAIRDGDKAMPQSYAEWTRFYPVLILVWGASALVGFA